MSERLGSQPEQVGGNRDTVGPELEINDSLTRDDANKLTMARIPPLVPLQEQGYITHMCVCAMPLRNTL